MAKYQEATISLGLPLIAPEAKKLAEDLVSARLVFADNGVLRPYSPQDVDSATLRQEASRLANLTDPVAREAAILEALNGCIAMVAQAQKLASIFHQTAIELDTLSQKLTLADLVLVQKDHAPKKGS